MEYLLTGSVESFFFSSFCYIWKKRAVLWKRTQLAGCLCQLQTEASKSKTYWLWQFHAWNFNIYVSLSLPLLLSIGCLNFHRYDHFGCIYSSQPLCPLCVLFNLVSGAELSYNPSLSISYIFLGVISKGIIKIHRTRLYYIKNISSGSFLVTFNKEFSIDIVICADAPNHCSHSNKAQTPMLHLFYLACSCPWPIRVCVRVYTQRNVIFKSVCHKLHLNTKFTIRVLCTTIYIVYICVVCISWMISSS